MKATTITVRDEALRERVIQHIAALNLDKPWDITIKRHVKKRSLSQNALMWKWITEVAEAVSEHTGMDAGDVHEFFKAKFLPGKVIEMGGESVLYRSTRDLATGEMADYMDRIYAFATTELGLFLSAPELAA